MERKRRIHNIDFSEHTHRVEIFKSEEGNEIRVDHFQKGDSRCGYIKFINTDETLTITGDYGNWVFCRPFVPSENSYVSDHYWLEKLRIGSEQRFDNLDFKPIIKDIENKIDHELEDYGYSEDKLDEAKEWFAELLDVAKSEDKLEYEYKAYRDYYKPNFIDYDEIPYYKEEPIWLYIIFDAFDEICSRLENKK